MRPYPLRRLAAPTFFLMLMSVFYSLSAAADSDLRMHSMALPVVYFVTDSVELTAQAVNDLDQLTALPEQNSQARLRVVDHTDTIGSIGCNQRLSEQRLQAVVTCLVRKGISVHQLIPQAVSETLPMVTNSNQTGRSNNRRVVFLEE